MPSCIGSLMESLCGWSFNIKKCFCPCYWNCGAKTITVVVGGNGDAAAVGVALAAINAAGFSEYVQENTGEKLDTKLERMNRETIDKPAQRLIKSGIRMFAKKQTLKLSPSRRERAEGYERLRLAEHLCEIDLQEKESDLSPLTIDEQKLLLEKVKTVKKYGSFAAFMWSKYKLISQINKKALKKLRDDGCLSNQLYKAFLPFVKKRRHFTNIGQFADLSNGDKKSFLLSAEKIMKAVKGWRSCFFNVPEVEQCPDFFRWTRKAQAIELVPGSLRESVFITRGDFETRDVFSSGGAGDGAGGAGVGVDTAAFLLSLDEPEMGGIPTIQRATREDRVKMKTVQLSTLIRSSKNSTEVTLLIQELAPSMYYIFEVFKKAQSLSGSDKVEALREGLTDPILKAFSKLTKGKKKTFFKVIEQCDTLINLNDDYLILFFKISQKFEEGIKQAHKVKYPLVKWLDVVAL